MFCPKDDSELESYHRHSISIETCPTCEGLWLDFNELDLLEDVGFNKDLDKGSLVFASRKSEYPCPMCGKAMITFKYRLNSLYLDACPQHHGFWLDTQEDEAVIELMDQREKDIKRKIKSEEKWEKTLPYFRNPTLINRLRRLLPG